MELNQLHTVWYSPTQTSKKVARAIAEGIGIARRTELDLTTDRCTDEKALKDSICIVAAPVYGGLLAPVAARRIARLRAENCVAIPVVVYGNRDYEDALVQLRDMLAGQGFTVLCGAAFVGEHSYSRSGMPIAEGRPDETDLQRAREFGRTAYTRLLHCLAPDTVPDPAARNFALRYDQPLADLIDTPPMKGNIPYKTLGPATPQAPVVNDLCYGCGECVDRCPTGAIILKDGRSDTVLELCTKCCACVKDCPVGARIFDTPYTARLHQMCTARREPECFV